MKIRERGDGFDVELQQPDGKVLVKVFGGETNPSLMEFYAPHMARRILELEAEVHRLTEVAALLSLRPPVEKLQALTDEKFAKLSDVERCYINDVREEAAFRLGVEL